MKDLSKNGLSDFQLIALIFVAASGTSIIFLPRSVAEAAGRDGWISIILGGCVALAVAVLIYFLCSRFPRRILPEFSMLILGKPLGIIVSAAYVVYALLLGGTTLLLFGEVTKTWVLFWTPQYVLIVSMLIPVIYITLQGPVPLGRFTELIFYFVGLVVLILLLPLPEANLINVRPVGAEGLATVLGGIGQLPFAFLGIEVMFIFFPLFVNRGRVLRLYLLAVMLLVVFYTGLTLFTYALLGVENTKLQVWPLISYLSAARVQIIERFDNIFLFIMTAKIIGLVAVHYYAAAATSAVITGGRYFNLFILLLLPALYGITLLPARQYAAFEFASLVGTWGALFVGGMVLLLLSVTLIRGLDEREETNK